ncbi:MAG: hypothetical protein ACOVRM_05500, partial [Planctomycetaceae bacterium]
NSHTASSVATEQNFTRMVSDLIAALQGSIEKGSQRPEQVEDHQLTRLAKSRDLSTVSPQPRLTD